MPHDVDTPPGPGRSPLSRIGSKTYLAVSLLCAAALAFDSLALAVILLVLTAYSFFLLVWSRVRIGSGRVRLMIPAWIGLLITIGLVAYVAASH